MKKAVTELRHGGWGETVQDKGMVKERLTEANMSENQTQEKDTGDWLLQRAGVGAGQAAIHTTATAEKWTSFDPSFSPPVVPQFGISHSEIPPVLSLKTVSWHCGVTQRTRGQLSLVCSLSRPWAPPTQRCLHSRSWVRRLLLQEPSCSH